MTIAQGTKYAIGIANGPYGYSQGMGAKDGRWSGLTRKPGNFDCSSASGAISWMSGFIDRDDLKGTFYTGNIVQRLVSTGMYVAISTRGWSLAELKSKARDGDFIRGEGHVVYAIGKGQCVSFEANEKGTKLGGKLGDQNGIEGRVRTIYARSRGWSHIIRPIAFNDHLGRYLAYYSKFGSVDAKTATFMRRRSPWDGPRWTDFVKRWAAIDKGLALNFDAALVKPKGNHVFVVLGSALNADGSIKGKLKRRLDLVKVALDKHTKSKVLITGGAPKAGVTEARAGQLYLEKLGVDPSRILVETKSASTVGNALNTVEQLDKFDSYTLVSDASHLRRATILFQAAQVKAETKDNKPHQVAQLTPLAFNDYGSKPIKPTRPVTIETRRAVALEVATLAGVATPFKSAL